MSNSVQPHRRQPTRLHCPWDSPGKNTGVGCHFLLQCVKVKSLSHVQLLATLWTAAHQAPPSMGFSRQEDWSGVPLPSPLILQQLKLCLSLHFLLVQRLGDRQGKRPGLSVVFSGYSTMLETLTSLYMHMVF